MRKIDLLFAIIWETFFLSYNFNYFVIILPLKFVYMSLKELTMQQHRDAERQKFVEY